MLWSLFLILKFLHRWIRFNVLYLIAQTMHEQKCMVPRRQLGLLSFVVHIRPNKLFSYQTLQLLMNALKLEVFTSRGGQLY